MPKTLLLLGLGKYAPTSPPPPSTTTTTDSNLTPSTIKAAVASQTSTLSSLGFTCTKLDLNPSDPNDSLLRLKQLLTSQPGWDGIVIGFGLRGNVELTELFEKVVNLSRGGGEVWV
ncbi:hypothetical protein M409DRAFT_29673 [Zasmidium cellare ATCC 36951]|uniref:Uncharacterized protein n=1 Tax=Zasmidium cellare ATCC 36951 TaxID=1080233 RepID=A0A6A6BZ33_ZASCE|nr:uncharacterized protein M409DRAFT_29673 [Zasmidium cellare ATCC 36951]KAF2159863.1 hypothetical protein M409DRAFT_29673 [Zasmidium cellare ATCC 36951]